MLDPRTRVLLEEHAPGPVAWREIDPGDESHYARILIEAWAEPGDLTIVEHDIGIRAGVLEELGSCSQPWCGFPYPIGQQLLVCLGCTRFSARLKTAFPSLMADAAAVGPEDGGGVPAGTWRRLDVRIGVLLERYGHARHVHGPPVEHYHHYA